MKLKLARETSIYISDVGYLVIVQEDLIKNCEETIMLSPDQSESLIVFLSQNMAEQKKKWVETIYQEDQEEV